MDGVRLADRLAYGAGCAARRMGYLCDAYRPTGLAAPINLANRFLRLAVALALPGGNVSAPSGFGVPFRQAFADWSYLRVGDYLVGPEGTAFVAAIEPPKPMLVVLTNDVITISRNEGAALPGLNDYGAILPCTETVLLAGFPASLLAGGLSDRTRAGLPDDTKVAGFIAIVPRVDGFDPKIADMVVNERRDQFVVTSVESLRGIYRLSMTPVSS
jgi:hypothetical protein